MCVGIELGSIPTLPNAPKALCLHVFSCRTSHKSTHIAVHITLNYMSDRESCLQLQVLDDLIVHGISIS